MYFLRPFPSVWALLSKAENRVASLPYGALITTANEAVKRAQRTARPRKTSVQTALAAARLPTGPERVHEQRRQLTALARTFSSVETTHSPRELTRAANREAPWTQSRGARDAEAAPPIPESPNDAAIWPPLAQNRLPRPLFGRKQQRATGSRCHRRGRPAGTHSSELRGTRPA